MSELDWDYEIRLRIESLEKKVVADRAKALELTAKLATDADPTRKLSWLQSLRMAEFRIESNLINLDREHRKLHPEPDPWAVERRRP